MRREARPHLIGVHIYRLPRAETETTQKPGYEVSADTKAALETALEAHLSDEHDMPAMLTGYILQAVGNSAYDDRDLLCYTGKTGQSGVITLGLLSYIQANAEGVTFDAEDDD